MPIPALDHFKSFTISVPDEQLRDLKTRLRATRWPEDIGNEDWFYGVNGAYLKQLVEYWIDSFDWRKAEGQINGYANYRLIIDDVPVHCLYKAGNGKSPIPIILSHGWPWTFWDWSKVIDPLADPGRFGGRLRRSAWLTRWCWRGASIPRRPNTLAQPLVIPA
jgi:hypothetical protein